MTKELTLKELEVFDGSDIEKPVYVAINGHIFDVSSNREQYTPPKGYSVFAGKEANRALAKSSLKKEDCIPDTTDLTAEELETLQKWFLFFEKKYPKIAVIKKD